MDDIIDHTDAIIEIVKDLECQYRLLPERDGNIETILDIMVHIVKRAEEISGNIGELKMYIAKYNKCKKGWMYKHFPAVMEELEGYRQRINMVYNRIRFSPERRRAFYVYITDKYYRRPDRDPVSMDVYRLAESIGRKSMMEDTSIVSPVPTSEDYENISYMEDQERGTELEKVFKLFAEELEKFERDQWVNDLKA
jgi:hypothetical protein